MAQDCDASEFKKEKGVQFLFLSNSIILIIRIRHRIYTKVKKEK